jgi:hypothetical protein
LRRPHGRRPREADGKDRYKVGADKRISAIGIFNSGEFTAPATAKTAAAVKGKPVFYFLGGPSDIAYKNV